MSAVTSIEWTDRSWNPVRGCSRVSEGCRHCYAERVAARFSGPGKPYEGLATAKGWTGEVRLVEKALAEPLRWRKPQRVFVNSMSDLFHESLPDEAIDRVFAVMALAPQHQFQVLTKRAERMRQYLSAAGQLRGEWDGLHGALRRIGVGDLPGFHVGRAATVEAGERIWRGGQWPLPNVWLGVSVEDQQRADERIPHLLATPAAVRFLSVEPMLGAINVRGHALDFPAGNPGDCTCGHGHGFTRCPNTGGVAKTCHRPGCTCPGFRRRAGAGLHWVIVGGESGPGARPCSVTWIRSVVEQCRAAGVRCFVKQLGARPVDSSESDPDDSPRRSVYGRPLRLRDRKGGDPAEWPEDIRVREFPEVGR